MLLENYPPEHPIHRIHKASQTNWFLRELRFGISILTVVIMLIPSYWLRIAWALILNLFTNHLENYKALLQKAYTATLAQLFSGLFYFLFLAPYGLLGRLLKGPKSLSSQNTDLESSRYQS